MIKPAAAIVLPLFMTGCFGSNHDVKYTYPVASDVNREQNFGKLFGDDKLVMRLNNSATDQNTGGTQESLSQNIKGADLSNRASVSLWKAAVATVSNMPIIIADSSSGLIATDWHNIPDLDRGDGNKYKVSIIVNDDKTDRSTAKVKIFAQNKAGISESKLQDMAQKIETKIIDKAKSMKSTKG